jgi:hypothetical protein
MLRSIAHVSISHRGFAARASVKRRSLCLISVHRALPATLYRFQLQRESGLYDKQLQGDDQDFNDAVEVSNDGLVRPGITGDGAQLLLPLHYPHRYLRIC